MKPEVGTAFLDRDGVINAKPQSTRYITSADVFEFLPGAIEAIRRLNEAGVLVVVVTNQRGVATGEITPEALEGIHAAMTAGLATFDAHVDAILVCPHDVDTCACRKPQIGLFLDAARLMPQIDLAQAVVIGDSRSDIEAGRRLGCGSYLVGTTDDARALREEGLPLRGHAESLLLLVSDLLSGEFNTGHSTLAS